VMGAFGVLTANVPLATGAALAAQITEKEPSAYASSATVRQTKASSTSR
jgi:TPP-dependent pyruvate/acetoin dehydrogenase alpha subunit